MFRKIIFDKELLKKYYPLPFELRNFHSHFNVFATTNSLARYRLFHILKLNLDSYFLSEAVLRFSVLYNDIVGRREVYIRNILVNPKSRGQGLAESLLNHLFEFCGDYELSISLVSENDSFWRHICQKYPERDIRVVGCTPCAFAH